MKNFNFKFIKKYDIGDLKNEILNMEKSHWKFRQKERHDTLNVHEDVMSIFYRRIPQEFEYIEKVNLNKIIVDNTIPPHIKEKIDFIVNDLENIYNGKAGITSLLSLKAQGKIREHYDLGKYLNLVNRIHIPIKTSNKVLFFVGDEMMNMKEGECVEIDNTKKHFVINQGSEDRIHLLIDIIPNEYIEK